jgi:hypothetical protein
MTPWFRWMTPRTRWMTPRFRRLTAWIRRMTPWIRTMFDLFVGCAAAGADFAVPGVASGSRVVGAFVDGLFGSGLLVGVRLFYMLYLFDLECVPMPLSVPASCHRDRCFCHSPYAVPAAYLHPHAVRSPCLRSHASHCLSTFSPVVRLLHFRLRSYAVRTLCPRRRHAAVCVAESSRGPFRSLRVLRDGRGGRVHAPHARHATIFSS